MIWDRAGWQQRLQSCLAWDFPWARWAFRYGSIELAPKGREVQTIRNFQICYALGGFIFMLLPGFLAEAFGTYLVSYAALFFMLLLPRQ